MSSIQSQNDKYGNSNYIGSVSIEGTSARTRPFSFEQAMSRRRNKIPEEMAKEKAPLPRLRSERGDAVNSPPHRATVSENKHMKDSKDTARSSKTKEESALTRTRSPRSHKNKMQRELEPSEKAKFSHERINREKEDRKDGSHHRIRSEVQSTLDFEKGSSKKYSKDAQIKDKRDDEDSKFMRDKNRKSLSGIDKKPRRDTDVFTLKKHDFGKRQAIEPFERKRFQRYDEPRTKRQRSTSWEYDRERDRGSISVSPKVHKRSFHGRDYVESSSRPLKDKPGRQHTDTEKYRTSGNGSYDSGHYRRRGSGLGGYSPRKRRPDAAIIKIPSPTVRSPERKGATWDLPPPEANKSISTPLPNYLPSSTLNVQDKPPVPESPMKPSSQQTPPSKLPISLASIDSVHLTQATRPMRRLYIENLPASATDKSITGCLNDFLLSTGANHIPGTEPCISCIINKEKSQAVVEFLTPEDATAALSFDGKSFSGSVLKLRRPKDFMDAITTTGALEKSTAVINTVSDVVEDSPHKIFIGGITEFLSSNMLLEVAGVFGLVKAYHFEFNPELNQSYAFLEYVDQSVTHKACAALNGMKLGGNVLTVVLALQDSQLREEKDERPPFYGIPEHAKPLLEEPTQILKLINVFDQEAFLQLSEFELEEIVEDIRIECARFGTVKSVKVVKSENRGNATTKVEELLGESDKMKLGKEPFEGDSNQITEQVPLDDVENTSYAGEVLSHSEATVDNVETEIQESDHNQPSQGTADAIQEELLQSEVVAGDPTSVSEDEKPEETHESHVENGLASDEPKQVEVETDSGRSFPEPDPIIPEKLGTSIDDGNQQTEHMLELGCVLVEFLRKEVACIAAHSLNGRSYDGRRVATSYVAYDIYVTHFRR